MTNILYTMLLSNILCANGHVYTHENIFEELVECQNQIIESQRNCFELHKFDTYIMISFKNGIGFKKKLDAKILEMIQEYIKVTGNEQFKLTATVNKKRCEGFDQNMVLEFFQNAYTINSSISEDLKTDDAIINGFDYFFAYNISLYSQINLRLSEVKKNLQIEYDENNSMAEEGCSHDKLNTQKSLAHEYVDIILIDNCLHKLQDFELFYNEIIKPIDYNVYKTSLIFIALKLDEKQKIQFNESKLLLRLEFINLYKFKNLKYHAACLENRTPFGKFVQNNNYILGKVFSNQYGDHHAEESDFFFNYYENICKNSALTYDSFTSSIFRIEKNYDHECKNQCIIIECFSCKYYRIKTIYVSIGKNTFEFENYYKVKLIYDVQKEERSLRLNIIMHYKYPQNHHRIAYARYYIYTDDGEIPNLVSDNDKPDNEKIKQQHDKLSDIVKNIKKFLNASFIHYNMKYPILLLSNRNSMYVDYYKTVYSRKISILWDYENVVKSVSTLIDKIGMYFKKDDKIVLFEYKPMLEQLLVKLINNEEIEMFDYVQNLKILHDFSTDTEFNENLNKKDLCLQICLTVNNYIQYYYLFLPIFAFQIIKYEHLQNKALVLFNEILKEKIEDEKSENNVAVIKPIINEIIKIKNIPLKVFWLHFADLIDDKFDFMIYTIILVLFRANGYIRDLELKNHEFRELEFSTMHELYNANFEIKRYDLYSKIIKIPFFEELFCHSRNLINESSKHVVEKLRLEVENNKYNFCYIQSGNNYLANNNMEEIIK
ncbi:hypothetical protein COBT_001215, partial [Conglomerata obtusa]